MEVRNLRLRMQDLLGDLEEMQKRKDEAAVQEIQKQLEALEIELNKNTTLDDIMKYRLNIVSYGCISPAIKTEAELLALGHDADFVSNAILALSRVPNDFADVVSRLFRPREPDNPDGSPDREAIQRAT